MLNSTATPSRSREVFSAALLQKWEASKWPLQTFLAVPALGMALVASMIEPILYKKDAGRQAGLRRLSACPPCSCSRGGLPACLRVRVWLSICPSVGFPEGGKHPGF